ncbi:MAG: M48 family metallopeptidase [Pseudobdellovibrionaceae bacterium]
MNYVPKDDVENPNVSKEDGLKSFLTLASATLFVCAILFFSAAWLGEKLILLISPQQEISSFAKWSSKFGTPWPEGEKVLSKIFGENAKQYNLIVLKEESPNAFAFPGRVLGVTCGLLNGMKSENGLAFVMGHELGHFHHQDHLKGVGRALGLGIGMMFLGISAGEGAMIQLGQDVMARSFNRGQESAADAFSVALLKKTYGGVQGATEFFDLIQSQPESALRGSERWENLLSTHPHPETRIKLIQSHNSQNQIESEEVIPLSSEVRQVCLEK